MNLKIWLGQVQERSIIVEKPLKPSAESIKESESAQKKRLHSAAKASLETPKAKEDQKEHPATETEELKEIE